MEQAISNFDACGCQCGTPVYIGLRTGEGGPAPDSFPMEVFNTDGHSLGIAANKQEYISLWNTDAVDGDDQALGLISDMISPFSFLLCLNDGQEAPAFLGAGESDLRFTWTVSAGELSLQITMGEGASDDISISWGDGTVDTILFADLADAVSHTYSVPGRYEVKIFAHGQAIAGLDVSSQDLTEFSPTLLPDTLQTINASENSLKKFVLATVPSALLTLNLDDNQLTAFSPAGYPEGMDEFDLNDNKLATIDIEHMPSTVTTLELSGNQLTDFDSAHIPAAIIYLDVEINKLPSEVLDAILEKLDDLGLSDGSVLVGGQIPDAPLGSGGLTAKSNLEGKGWSVSIST